MKGYYLFAPVEPACVGPQSGVERKVRAQHKALSQYLDCELVILEPVKYTQSLSERIVRRLPGTAAWRKWKYQGEFDDADFLYIRQVYHDAAFVRWLRDLKQANPKVKIIYEVPTYPYDTERSVCLSSIPFELKERLNRWRAAKYFDRIITFYGQDSIWGTPCLKLINGFDFSRISLPRRKREDVVHVLSVALTSYWHAYDRFIEGLHRYYQNGGQENIVYHLVGNILPEHQKMVQQYGLEGRVIFYGMRSGQELQEIYKKCLIGIDMLGGHRSKNHELSSTLKSREYGAYGLPLITSSPIDFLGPEYPYQFLVSNDDEPVDIQALMAFYHRIYDNADLDQVASYIREYAQSRCDMPVTLEPAVEWLLSKTEE